MRIIFTVIVLFIACRISSQTIEHIYAGKDSTFYRIENTTESKRALRNATDAFLCNSTGVLGSGFVSSIDGKESKLTAQFVGNLSGAESNVMAPHLKFSGTTDDSFYGIRGLKRPTFSISGGGFILIEPGIWRLNKEDYLKKAKNHDIPFDVAEPIKTSYKWLNISGGFDNGELKIFKLNNNVFEPQREFIRSNSIAVSYNLLRTYNNRDYKLTGFKTSYSSFGVEWVRLSNFRNLPTIDANMQSTMVDTSGATINLYQDLGAHYISKPEAPFLHYREMVFKLNYMLETVTGWVISTAVNYHRPSSNEDDIRTPFYNEKRIEYLGFEGGIQYSASNKAGKSIANIGVFGDYRYSNSWHGWIVSLRTSIPISL